MVGFEYLSLFVLVLTVFPFSLVQIEIALNHEHDLEAFMLWVFIAGLMAGLPWMATAVL